MMHGPEKSDLPIVPLKLANKVGRPAAEPVEGRGGAEGNAGSQSTVRTQSREAVSQARDRIREAVNRNNKEKLTALLHHVSVDVLRAAFFALKRTPFRVISLAVRGPGRLRGVNGRSWHRHSPWVIWASAFVCSWRPGAG